MILVKWTYTTEEWKNFLRIAAANKNILSRLRKRMASMANRTPPQVSISAEKVWIGNDQQYFSSGRHQLYQIDLRNEGAVNVLAISFGNNGKPCEIKVPVPKGKLREAIAVQDRLMPVGNY